MTAKSPQTHVHHQSFWLWVMCLTGVDYFSTLGYQPSIAFNATGLLTPIATGVLVLVTLFGALPVYAHVCRRSPHGQGSIAMLERLVSGWWGKTLVLVLLGFAATDFVITKTLSAADATAHLIENPYWHEATHALALPPWAVLQENQQVAVTMLLLVFLGATFLRGFREVIGLAVAIVGSYLTLNAIVIGSGLYYLLAEHPEKLQQWWTQIQVGTLEAWQVHEAPVVGGTWWMIIAACLLLFPKLALGLSGFETGVAVMPLVKGKEDDQPAEPRGRIRNTRKLLVTAALIMSVYLLGSSLVTSMLIPAEDLRTVVTTDPVTGEVTQVQGRAADRALAYLAHGQAPERISPLFGNVFGTIYDVVTIVILWFAGASAMAGLLNLVPQYLPRYGMAPEWARAIRPLVVLFTLTNLLVTWVFTYAVNPRDPNNDTLVEVQGGAYATGVLVLMTSACAATVIDRWRAHPNRFLLWRVPWYFLLVALVFIYITGDIILTKPDGLKIASFFIAAIIVASIVSRAYRSTELRFIGFEFVDAQSRFLWESMKHLEFPVLVPHRPGHRKLIEKEESIRKEHRLTADIPIVFVEAELGDPSEFYQIPLLEVKQEEGRFIIRVTRCASIAHVIAAILLELSKVGKPPELHFGWSDESPLAANLSFLLFGEGNIPWLVRELIRKAEPDPERQPRIVIG